MAAVRALSPRAHGHPANAQSKRLDYSRSKSRTRTKNDARWLQRHFRDFPDNFSEENIQKIEDRWSKPDFLGNVKISKDTFSNLDELYSSMKILYALANVAFIFINVAYIVSENGTILAEVVKSSFLTNPDSSEGDASLIQYPLRRLGVTLVRPRFLVACFEFILLLLYFLKVIKLTIISFYGKREVGRYHAIATLYWDVLDQLSTISALRLLHWLTPSVFIKEMGFAMDCSDDRPCYDRAQDILKFAAFRLVAGVVGLECFFVKMSEVAGSSDSVNYNEEILFKFAFLRQVLGIFQIRFYLQKRLFIFVFGGHDGVVQVTESLDQQVWRAMLAKRMWQRYGNTRLTYFTMMLTYDDYDFQKLILEPDDEETLAGGQSPNAETSPTYTGAGAELDAARGAGGDERLREELRRERLKAADAKLEALCARMELHQLRAGVHAAHQAKELRKLAGPSAVVPVSA